MGSESTFVNSVIRLCETDFDITINLNRSSDNEIENQIQEIEEKLKDSSLSRGKKKKLKLKWKTLINLRKTKVPSIVRTTSYDVKEEHKLLKEKCQKLMTRTMRVTKTILQILILLILIPDSDSDSDSSGYDTEDSDDGLDDEGWIDGGFGNGFTNNDLFKEDENIKFGKDNFTPRIK